MSAKYGILSAKYWTRVCQQLATPPLLVGTLVKKIVIKPYKAKSITKAIKLGNYDDYDGDIATIFADDEVGLTEEVSVDLFQFNRNWTYDEVATWVKDHGNKKPILPKHIYGIGIHLPGEQFENPIVETGSVRGGSLLYLHGSSVWRDLSRGTGGASGWHRDYLVGFLSE